MFVLAYGYGYGLAAIFLCCTSWCSSIPGGIFVSGQPAAATVRDRSSPPKRRKRTMMDGRRPGRTVVDVPASGSPFVDLLELEDFTPEETDPDDTAIRIPFPASGSLGSSAGTSPKRSQDPQLPKQVVKKLDATARAGRPSRSAGRSSEKNDKKSRGGGQPPVLASLMEAASAAESVLSPLDKEIAAALAAREAGLESRDSVRKNGAPRTEASWPQGRRGGGRRDESQNPPPSELPAAAAPTSLLDRRTAAREGTTSAAAARKTATAAAKTAAAATKTATSKTVLTEAPPKAAFPSGYFPAEPEQSEFGVTETLGKLSDPAVLFGFPDAKKTLRGKSSLSYRDGKEMPPGGEDIVADLGGGADDEYAVFDATDPNKRETAGTGVTFDLVEPLYGVDYVVPPTHVHRVFLHHVRGVCITFMRRFSFHRLAAG